MKGEFFNTNKPRGLHFCVNYRFGRCLRRTVCGIVYFRKCMIFLSR